MISKSNSPYCSTYAVAISWSDVAPFIWSQRNRSCAESRRKRSVVVFLRTNPGEPATRERSSEISYDSTRRGRELR